MRPIALFFGPYVPAVQTAVALQQTVVR